MTFIQKFTTMFWWSIFGVIVSCLYEKDIGLLIISAVAIMVFGLRVGFVALRKFEISHMMIVFLIHPPFLCVCPGTWVNMTNINFFNENTTAIMILNTFLIQLPKWIISTGKD